MFGNRLGWVIAAVLALAMGLSAWQISRVNDLTGLTPLGESADTYEPLKLPMEPVTIVTMDRPGDAGRVYRSVIEDVLRRPERYQAFIDGGQPDDWKSLPLLEKMVDVTPIVGGDILLTHAEANVGYTPESDELKAILLAGHCMSRMALLTMASDPIRANAIFRAEFALGAKLFAERISFYEAFDGIGLMQETIDGLRVIAVKNDNKALVAALEQFNKQTNAWIDAKLTPMWKVISAVDDRVIAEHAGDIYAFTGPAMHERLWRIESILKLGRHRVNVNRLADQAAIPARLRELKATETDPAILAAVDKAEHLTLDEYRSIR